MAIVLSAAMSLSFVVEWWLQVPVSGSRVLFLGGACVYVFTVASLGIALGTVASTMAQFGLLSIPVLLAMMLLSGSTTPMESMPVWMQYLMRLISPTPHFVVFAQDVLYRGAGFSIVWRVTVAMTMIGAAYFGFALYRFAGLFSAAADGSAIGLQWHNHRKWGCPSTARERRCIAAQRGKNGSNA